MLDRIKYTGLYRYLVINPDKLAKIAILTYEPRRTALEAAGRKWENEEQEKIIKRISQHNKDVKAKKLTYAFRTDTIIDKQQQENILEQEKLWFIHTSQRVYEFDSEFSVHYSNGKSEIHSDPDFLKEVVWERVSLVEFSVKTRNPEEIKNVFEQSTHILINPENNRLTYTITGTKKEWVKSFKLDLEEQIQDFDKVHPFTKKIVPAVILISILITYLIFSFYYKFDLNDYLYSIGFQHSDLLAYILSPLIFLLSVIMTGKELGKSFPDMLITTEYKPLEHSKTIWFIFSLVIAAVGNGFYDLIRSLLINI